MTRTVCAVLTFLALTPRLGAQDRAQALEAEARMAVGQTATLCGTVVEYQCLRPLQTSRLALESSLDGPGVSIAVDWVDRLRFGRLLEAKQLGRTVCATGRVTKAGNRYVVSITDPVQLEVRAEASPVSVFPMDTVSSCEPDIEVPKLLNNVQPRYTATAMRARIEGRVQLEALVLADGAVGTARVLKSLEPGGLDKEALKALSQWRFSPSRFAGHPVPMLVVVEMSFRIKP